MTRATFDTNVLASGFVGRYRPESTPGALVRAWRRGAFVLASSEVLLAELAATFQQPYFRRQLTDADSAAALDLLRREATIVSLTATVAGVATHPEDDLVLATAVSAGSDYLVTGDGPLLRRVSTYEGVRLLSPRAFLTLLEERS